MSFPDCDEQNSEDSSNPSSFHAITARFVELQPRAKNFYGFKDDEENGKRMMEKHAEGIVHLFDSILQMLGKLSWTRRSIR